MGENTEIEWAHHTFNAWIGCTKVGPPCDHCYAEAENKRRKWAAGGEWGPHAERKRTAVANWRKPLQWDKAAAAAGERHRVFSLSLGDWLDNQVPQEWREDLARLIEMTPNLDWLLLTKRIGNYASIGPALWLAERAPRNVWFGITCGDQVEYDRDWPKLAEIDAAVRFISYEPALGPLRLYDRGIGLPDWIIAGGESGPKARAPEPQWFRDLAADCYYFDIEFLFKQWGEFTPNFLGINDSLPLARVGKKRAGRSLDGVTYDGYPTPRIR